MSRERGDLALQDLPDFLTDWNTEYAFMIASINMIGCYMVHMDISMATTAI